MCTKLIKRKNEMLVATTVDHKGSHRLRCDVERSKTLQKTRVKLLPCCKKSLASLIVKSHLNVGPLSLASGASSNGME